MKENKNNYIISVDSGCDLQMSVCRKRNIIPLQLTYNIDCEQKKDTMEERDYQAFYNRMRNGSISKTSQANLYEYLDFWYQLVPLNLPIIHITLGSGVSNSYNSGLLARKTLLEKFPNVKIYLVDSKIASLGYGMLAIQAANMRDNGVSVDECYEWLEENKLKVNTLYTTGEFKYLYQSGRVSKIGAFFGKILNINSILKVDSEGKMFLFNKTPGTKRTEKIIKDNIAKTVENAESQTLYICHSDNEKEAYNYGEKIKQELGFKDVFYSYIGPTVGSHTGPGLIAIFFFGINRNKSKN